MGDIRVRKQRVIPMGKSRKNDTTTHMRNIQNLLKKGDEEAVVNYFLGLRRHKPASWINIFEGLEEDQIIVIDILLSTLEDKSLDKKNKALIAEMCWVYNSYLKEEFGEVIAKTFFSGTAGEIVWFPKVA